MNRLKALIEKRADLQAELEGLLNSAETEQRALNADEQARFDAVEQEIKDIDATIQREERARNMEQKKAVEEPPVENRAEMEERAFLNYIRREAGLPVEERDGEQNFDMGNNGAVIPTTIANRIISKVSELCPIFAGATRFNVKGNLKIPVYGKANTTHDITVGYQTEFQDIVADAGKFTSVDLSGFLAGALTLIGRSVINNAGIDVLNFVVNEMARKIAEFIEGELLNGTADKAAGALSTTTNLNAGSTSAINADNLIELQAKIPTPYQAKACWTMHPSTFTAIKKLKDGEGRYLLQSNIVQGFPYTLLGKPVYLSDNMPAIGNGNKAILYGDYSGLAVNFREDINTQVLNEKYATQHAIGIVSWFEFDSDVMDHQRLATLTMSAV